MPHEQTQTMEPNSQSNVVNVQINVYADDDSGADSGVKFSHEWKFQDAPGQYNKGRVDLPANDSYTLKFHFQDRSSRNLSFACPGANAMWVTNGTSSNPPTCPTAAGDGGQIQYSGSGTNCSPNLLSVVDANSGPECLLQYALRFNGNAYTGPSGQQYPPYAYDPEIKNGGGATM